MKFDEVKKTLTAILEDPAGKLDAAADFIEKLEAAYTTMESMAEKISLQDTKIRGLQDVNMKLFLSKTQCVNDDTADEDEETVFDFGKVLAAAQEEE